MSLIQEILRACWYTLQMMAPYLLLGFFLSGVLSVILPVSWVKQHLARRGKASVFKSTLMGVPLPLCSCGVLPVATWIRRHGASKGATGAFLLATPQTGVDEFLVALAMLGLGFALFTPFAALLSGMALGMILNRFREEPMRTEAEDSLENGQKGSVPLRILRHGFVTIAGDIAVPLAVGVLASGVLSAFVDPQQFAEIGDGFVAKLLVVAAATPLYVCAVASVPVGASMLVAGLSPGTVFVFLMAGPATNAATFTTISRILGRREAVVYLLSAVVLAVAMGYLLDALVPVLPDIEAVCPHEHSEDALWRTAMAVILIGVLVNGKLIRTRGR